MTSTSFSSLGPRPRGSLGAPKTARGVPGWGPKVPASARDREASTRLSPAAWEMVIGGALIPVHPCSPAGHRPPLVAVFPHEHHPCSGGRLDCWCRPQKAVGLTPSARDWILRRVGPRRKWTWAWRHAY